jgi:hypothetical protein
MPTLTFGDIRALLAVYGHPGLTTILYSRPSQGTELIDDELCNVVIHTACQYGPTVLEFNEIGELASVTVASTSRKEVTIFYGDIVEALKCEGYEYPQCTEIVYTPDDCPVGNPEWADRAIYGSCSYGIVTIGFNEAGALLSIEVC